MSETKPEAEVATAKQSNEGVDTSPLPATLNDIAEEPSLNEAVQADPEKTETSPTATSDDGTLKGAALLKSLLSVSPASSVAAAAEKMITTTEVTDEKLNLRKILYQPDKTAKEEKLPESPTLNGSQANISSDAQNDDDDQRLIIDISDEERDGTAETKSMPSLGTSAEDDNSGTRRIPRPTTLEMKTFASTKHYARGVSENLLPESITYSLESSPVTGISSNVKIDILAPTASFIEVPTTTDKGSRLTNGHSSKCTKMTSLDELNVISREIDKQITKKTNKILELLKEFLCGMSDKNSFHTQMIDASDTSLSDLLLIAKKLIKRHKFESNPNHKEFMRIKFLNFPTTSSDLVVYFDNLLPSLNRDKFLSMIKFYEIIIKEMLNLNKTKILQYLIDFMVVRKNPQLDLLNYNFQVTSSPNLKLPSTPSKFQLPDSTQTPMERRQPRLHDTSYNFIIRSDPIYLQASSSFVTSHRNVITCRMSPRIQQRSFERRPFDNNVLKGRRIGRRLTRSPDGEKVHMDLLRGRYPPTPQSENGTPIQQKIIMTSTSIVLDADTPPPSLPSEPPSPPHHKIVRAPHQQTILHDASHLDLSTTMKPRDESKVDSPRDYLPTTFDSDVTKGSLKRQSSIRASDLEILETFSNDPLKNGQITVHEIQTLSQNGTEIIPTSILKNTIMNYRPAIEVDRAHLTISSHESEKAKAIISRGLSHEDQPIRPTPQAAPKILKRRQSCHERLMMPTKENEDMAIASSAIGRNYMKFLHMYEREIKQKDRLEQNHQIQYQQQQLQQTQQHQQHQQQQLHAQHKRVRFSAEVQSETQPNPRQPPSIHHSLVQQQQQHHLQMEHNRQRLLHQQQQQQQQQQQHHQQQQQLQQQANAQRSPIRSPIKPHAPPINYQFYEHQFERELRERGFDHRSLETHQANRPLELVSHIPPERYHQHEHQRAAHFANHTPQKLVQHVVEKSPRTLPRNGPLNEHHAAMMAAAYHQLQSLHRDPSSLSPQQYAEQLKQMEHLKHYQPSAFQAYQRSHQVEEQQRPLPEYYRNTQEHHQQPQQQPQLVRSPPPPQYQISSSSSREDSPNGFDIHQEQSLQRKLKNKTKSLKYVEPNQIAKPFYNPAHSTYFSEPFALTKNKANVTISPPTTFHPGEPPRPRSPLPRSQDYWYAEAKAQVQNLALQNQPQRPIPRPPVPAFESSISARPIHFEEQPTEFLRNYYAKNNLQS